MTLPKAFDEAGIEMIDSFREIYDIIQLNSNGSNIEYKCRYYNERDQVDGNKNGKCPVVAVLKNYYSLVMSHQFMNMIEKFVFRSSKIMNFRKLRDS